MKLQNVFITLAVAAILAFVLFAYLGHREGSDIAKNETSAYLFVRTIAEENQKLKTQTGAYSASLERVQTPNRPEFKRAKLAYFFKYQLSGDSFAINADPKKYGKTGIRSFYVDQTGVVRYDAGKSAGAHSAPVSSGSSTTTAP